MQRSNDIRRRGVERHTVFQEVRPGLGFETGDFVEEKGVGGATVEGLWSASTSND